MADKRVDQIIRVGVAKSVDAGLKDAFDGKRCSFVIAFQNPTSGEVHWITNVDRGAGAQLMRQVAEKMQGTIN